MSDWKYPLPDQLSYFWKVNRTPMIQLLVQVHRGVKGFVNDFESKQPIQGAELKIDGLDVTFETTSNGEYWRILLPREGYTVKVAATGYLSRRVGFTVTEGRVTKLNILLKVVYNFLFIYLFFFGSIKLFNMTFTDKTQEEKRKIVRDFLLFKCTV